MKKFNSTLVCNSEGFTLLEILIAITLLAFMVLGVVNITENAALTMERTTEINKNNLQIETAMSRFEWDFVQIYSPLYFSTIMNLNQNVNNFGNDGGAQTGNNTNTNATANQANMNNNPNMQAYFEQLVTRFERNEHFMAVSKDGMPIPRFYSPEKSVFEFFTSSNRRKLENTKQSHFAWVRYALGEQAPLPEGVEENEKVPKGLKSLIRYYTADDPYDDKRINPGDDNVKGAALLRNVEKLEFQFWDLNRRRWETSLRSIQGGESIIRGVKVLLTWYDSQGNKRSTSRIFRPHWPQVVPQDQAGGAPGAVAAGVQGTAGTQGTGGVNSGTPGMAQGGVNGF